MPNDVYLVSYPRSGNTWLRYLLANLLEPDGDWNVDNLSQVIPDIHQPWPDDWIERSPRIVKSHKAWQPDYPQVVYLYRDGRDVAVSYFDFQRKLRGYKESFDTFLEDYMQGHMPYGSWHDHVAGWLFKDDSAKLLPMRYESLFANTAQELTCLGVFLNATWSSSLIASAIDNSSIQRIRRDYQTLKFDTHWRRGFRGGVKGGPGMWREVLSPAQNERFWEKAGAVADKLGYERE